MNHRFKHTCYDVNALLDNCNTLKEFMKRIVKQSEAHPEMWDPMTYRGDGFEALVEVLITYSPIDARINIVDYRPWDSSQDGPDMGIDGTGFSHNGTIHTVQVKFRANNQRDLTANEDHISNFVSNSTTKYFGKIFDMTLFTTAKGLNRNISQDMYHDRVRTLEYKHISKMIDKNDSFWSKFKQEMLSKKA